MENRIRLNRSMRALISDFESTLNGQTQKYLCEKSYISLIDFYKSEYQTEKALQAVDMAIAQYSFRGEFYSIKAKLLLQDERPEEAIEIIDYAAIFSPGEIELVLLKALAYGQMQQFEKAIALTEDIKHNCLKDDLIDILYCEAMIYDQSRESDLMFDTLKTLLKYFPGHLEGLEKMYIATELTKRFDESISLHEYILSKNPYSYQAWFNLGHAYAFKRRYKEAIDALEYSFIINEEFLIGYKDCAELCMETGYVRHALSIYEDSYQQFKNDNEWLVGMGHCLHQLKKYKRAVEVTKRAIKLDSYDDEGWYLLGKVYLAKGDISNSIRHLNRAIELEDRREEYYVELAKAYVEQEDYTKAHYYFRKATEVGPEDETIWIEHVCFLLKTGQFILAIDTIEESELQIYSSALLYCKVICFDKLKMEKECLSLLSQMLDQDFASHHILAELDKEFLQREEVRAMFEYYTL